jgi:DNA repair exonuclease SbcCD ATPase subunit
LEAELRRLHDSKVVERATALPGARVRLADAVEQLAAIDREAATIPEDARCDPAQLEKPLHDADVTRTAAEAALRRALLAEQSARDAQQRRRDLEARSLDADHRLAILEKLAGLLGRDGLQRHLLREAERGVLASANPILAEVSGGELELRPSGGEDADPEHALQLEAVVRTHGEAHAVDVAFLSGSQRFRVAVSLALGIGRYARGLHRPIESVLIDEGFGCLDRQGRREMIDQLNALRGRLARIILVSHQEEFADAFSEGYHFEVIDGATRVTPFRR